MIVHYHRRFQKDLGKRSWKVRDRFYEREMLWRKDPRNPLLDDHPLDHEYAGCRSFSVSGDLRVVYQLRGNAAHFLRFGTHHELYGT
jgi:addiction module RelE/StbE family toxin